MKLRPAPDRAARHPGSYRLLKKEGETVTPSAYWRRLLANGDVERVPEDEAAPTAATSPAPAEPAALVEAQPATPVTEEAAHAE